MPCRIWILLCRRHSCRQSLVVKSQPFHEELPTAVQDSVALNDLVYKMVVSNTTRFARLHLRRPALLLHRKALSGPAAGSQDTNNRKTAAGCIIGNEILSGKIQDVNTHTLGKFCYETGLRLRKLEVVPDDNESIVESVRELSRRYDYVFTSGGIGSTHDDITYSAIAAAFGRALEYHQPTLDLIQQHSRGKPNEHRARMALFPAGSEIIAVPGLWVPLVAVGNVYILPGVPHLFERMLLSQTERFRQHKSLQLRQVFTRTLESDMAEALARAQSLHPGVEIGSYPKFLENRSVMVMLTVEGDDGAMVTKCVDSIRSQVECFDTAEECLGVDK